MTTEQELRDRVDQLEGFVADYESRWQQAEDRAHELERERDDLRYRAEDRERELQSTIDKLEREMESLSYRLRDAEHYDARYGR